MMTEETVKLRSRSGRKLTTGRAITAAGCSLSVGPGH
jgi:hypothetical protein